MSSLPKSVLQPRRLLRAAAVGAEQPARAGPAVVDVEARAQHVAHAQRVGDLVEVHVERRGDDHDFVPLPAVPRDAVARLGGDRASRELGAEARDPRLATSEWGTPASTRVSTRSLAMSRSPRPAAARARPPDSAASARITEVRPGDAGEERHERVASRERAVEVERGEGSSGRRHVARLAIGRLGHIGRRRNTAVGRWRNTVIT